MKKGFYTGAIAVVAVVIISIAAFSMVSTVQTTESKNQAKAIVEAKWQWQNASELLSKSASDAIADASYTASACAYETTAGHSKVSSYASDVISNTYSDCTIANILIDDSALPDIDISFELKCANSFSGNDSASYKKNVVVQKNVQTLFIAGTPNQCNVIVTDNRSGKIEVDQTAELD